MDAAKLTAAKKQFVGEMDASQTWILKQISMEMLLNP